MARLMRFAFSTRGALLRQLRFVHGMHSVEWNVTTSNHTKDGPHPVAIAYWVDENDVPIEVKTREDALNPNEALSELGHWLTDRIDAVGEVKASSGPRLGPARERTQRSGSVEEVCAPLLLRPYFAISTLRRRDVFGDPLGTIDVESDSLETSGMSCSWFVTLRTGPLRSRRATLRITPSPSGNITVLQLMPQESRRFYTRSFVKAGVPALDEVGQRISRVCSAVRIERQRATRRI